MSRKKRPSLADIANIANEAVSGGKREASSQEQEEPSPAAQSPAASETDSAETSRQLTLKKFTAPLREEQLDQLAILLASWTANKKVKFSVAEVLRLGLDKMLQLMEDDPDQAILELYEQEQRELAASATRKFGRSKGAKEYLQKAGKL